MSRSWWHKPTRLMDIATVGIALTMLSYVLRELHLW